MSTSEASSSVVSSSLSASSSGSGSGSSSGSGSGSSSSLQSSSSAGGASSVASSNASASNLAGSFDNLPSKVADVLAALYHGRVRSNWFGELIAHAQQNHDEAGYYGEGRSGVPIEVSVDRTNNTITVRDHGLGYSEDELKRALVSSAKKNSGKIATAVENKTFLNDGGIWASLTVAKTITVVSKAEDEDQAFVRFDAETASAQGIEIGTDTKSPSLGRGTEVIIKLDTSYKHLANTTTLGALISYQEGHVDSPITLAEEHPRSRFYEKGSRPWFSTGFFLTIFVAAALAAAYGLYQDKDSQTCDEPIYKWLFVVFGLAAFAVLTLVITLATYACGSGGPVAGLSSFMARHRSLRTLYINFMLLLLIGVHALFAAGGYYLFNTDNCMDVEEDAYRVSIALETSFLVYLTFVSINTFGRSFVEWDNRNSAVQAGLQEISRAASA